MTEIPGLTVIPDFVPDLIAEHFIEVVASGARTDPNPGVNGIDHVQRIMLRSGPELEMHGRIDYVLWLSDAVEPYMGFPDSIIATRYREGASLDLHVDPNQWSDTICVFNLGAPTTLLFSSGIVMSDIVGVDFPDRALMVMSGDSRYCYHHGIQLVEQERIAVVCRRNA